MNSIDYFERNLRECELLYEYISASVQQLNFAKLVRRNLNRSDALDVVASNFELLRQETEEQKAVFYELRQRVVHMWNMHQAFWVQSVGAYYRMRLGNYIMSGIAPANNYYERLRNIGISAATLDLVFATYGGVEYDGNFFNEIVL